MKNIVLSGILLIIALLGATYFVVGDAYVIGEDNINDLTMLGGIAVITITVFVSLKYINQMKNEKSEGKLLDPSWDGIQEFDNKIPTGWALVYIGAMFWVVWYIFIGYPTNQFSQIGQWNEETIEFQKKFEKKFENISEEELVSMGESVYLVQCAPCHAEDAEGIDNRAQNLTKRMSKEQVLDVIKHGSKGLDYPMGEMPAGMAAGEDAEIIAKWISSGSKGTPPPQFAACASCHGVDAKGMGGMSPDLTTYSNKLVRSILLNGKKGIIGQMPAFKNRLSDTQIKAVAAYLRSKGE